MFIYIGVRKELKARPLKLVCQGFLKTGTMSGRSEQRMLGVLLQMDYEVGHVSEEPAIPQNSLCLDLGSDPKFVFP